MNLIQIIILKKFRAISWWWLILAVVVWPFLIAIFLNVLSTPARQLAHASSGIIQPPILFSSVLFVVVIAGILLGAGNLRMRDIGLSKSTLFDGIIYTTATWIVLQSILVIASIITESGITLSDNVKINNLPKTLGMLGSQLFGNAFVEEVMFRGFLMPQLYLKFAGRSDVIEWRKLIAAIILSQLAFALIHIPILERLTIPGGSSLIKLLIIFIMGVFFALFYLRTSNLFLCIGLHALINTPTPVFQSMLQPEMVTFGLGVVLMLRGPRLLKTNVAG